VERERALRRRRARRKRKRVREEGVDGAMVILRHGSYGSTTTVIHSGRERERT
jgi:hypothetical protein